MEPAVWGALHCARLFSPSLVFLPPVLQWLAQESLGTCWIQRAAVTSHEVPPRGGWLHFSPPAPSKALLGVSNSPAGTLLSMCSSDARSQEEELPYWMGTRLGLPSPRLVAPGTWQAQSSKSSL